jgi:3-dehydro-L-gulonate-6-phosphate decarboxylase
MTTAPLVAKSTRKLQLALDVKSVPEALVALQQTAEFVDIIEVGTVLCLSAGMEAVRCIRATYPAHTILADIRIAEAGTLLAGMAYDAGADWVSVVSGAPQTTVDAVANLAQQRGRDMQLELSDGWDLDLVDRARNSGVSQFIIHRSRDGEATGNLAWSDGDLQSITELRQRGGRVSVTGGLTPADIETFSGSPVEIFIAGRGIYGADDPKHAGETYRSAVAGLPPVGM